MVDFLKNLGIELRGPMVVNVDNQGSIAPAKNPVLHDHSKHIDILTYSIHFMRHLVTEQRIHLECIPTKDMLVDLTKPRARHERLSEGIGLF